MRITNTQYLKPGELTNVGTVLSIQSNKGFTTADGFYHNLDEEIVKKV